MLVITENELPVFIGELIDAIEDILEDNNITIQNHERDQAVEDGADAEGLAILYGSDYGLISDAVEEVIAGCDSTDNMDTRILAQAMLAISKLEKSGRMSPMDDSVKDNIRNCITETCCAWLDET